MLLKESMFSSILSFCNPLEHCRKLTVNIRTWITSLLLHTTITTNVTA